jgi:YNFM family putative membrane transporter
LSASTINTKPRSFAQHFAVFLCGAIAFLDLYSTQPLLPLLTHVFHATETHVALTISASTVGVAITSLLLATFGQGFPRKRIIVLSMATLSVCTVLTATATTLNVLALWRFVQGLVTPGVFILTITYVTEEWPPLHVPRAMSGYVAGTVFGGFTGRFLGGVIAAHTSWRMVFLMLGILLALGAIVTHFLLAQPTAPRHTPPRELRFAPLSTSLRNPRLLATFGIGFCMLFTLVSVFSYITFYLADTPFHLSTQQLSYLFAVYLVGLAATLIAGTFLARFGLRHGILAAITLCISGVAITLFHSLVIIALGLAACSSGVFIAQTCANSFLRDASPPSSRVSAVGLYICSYYIGGTFGGILPGVAYRLAHWPGCVALTCAILCLAGGLAYFGWPPHHHERDPIPL